MTETTDSVLSIQGEQQGGVEEPQVYHSLGGPGVPVPLGRLAPKDHVQRLVIDVVTVEDGEKRRADGEWRRTVKQTVVDVVEYGEVSKPESTGDPTFDDIDDDAHET